MIRKLVVPLCLAVAVVLPTWADAHVANVHRADRKAHKVASWHAGLLVDDQDVEINTWVVYPCERTGKHTFRCTYQFSGTDPVEGKVCRWSTIRVRDDHKAGVQFRALESGADCDYHGPPGD